MNQLVERRHWKRRSIEWYGRRLRSVWAFMSIDWKAAFAALFIVVLAGWLAS